jgi:hypothetical protein
VCRGGWDQDRDDGDGLAAVGAALFAVGGVAAAWNAVRRRGVRRRRRLGYDVGNAVGNAAGNFVAGGWNGVVGVGPVVAAVPVGDPAAG